jgi:TonB family protein
MNRLQKKCFIVTAGVHLLLVVILVVGPAFFYSKPKADDLQVLDVIPANLIDAQFNSGVANATPPPPAPVVAPPPPQPQPVPPAPKPVVTPPTIMQTLEKAFKPEPVKPVPTPEPTYKPQISTTLVTRTAPKASPNASDAARARAIRSALRNLKSNLTPGTVVDMPGNSGGAAYASYRDAIATIYYDAWTPPAEADNEEANTRVSVTIANDGTVITARIVTPSGDAKVDTSIQRTLERVTFIAPFPQGAVEKERTYIINFNLKAKRMLE